jgi:hypothetical protein
VAPTSTETTVDVVFVHHYTDRTGDEPVARVPGARVTYPVDTARALVRDRVADYATKPDAAAAGKPDAETASTRARSTS